MHVRLPARLAIVCFCRCTSFLYRALTREPGFKLPSEECAHLSALPLGAARIFRFDTPCTMKRASKHLKLFAAPNTCATQHETAERYDAMSSSTICAACCDPTSISITSRLDTPVYTNTITTHTGATCRCQGLWHLRARSHVLH